MNWELVSERLWTGTITQENNFIGDPGVIVEIWKKKI